MKQLNKHERNYIKTYGHARYITEYHKPKKFNELHQMIHFSNDQGWYLFKYIEILMHHDSIILYKYQGHYTVAMIDQIGWLVKISQFDQEDTAVSSFMHVAQLDDLQLEIATNEI